MGEQVCLLHLKEPRVAFHVSVSSPAHRRSPSVIWYKFYNGQSPQYHRSEARALTPKTLGIEAYDLTRSQVGPLLEGDTVALRLPEYLHLSPSSFVQWIKEPRPLTLRDNQAVVIADDVEKMEISSLTESSFGYVRALVYDFHSEVPGRVLVAERLFFIKKDVSKTCEGSREGRSCHCNPGFEGRGVDCVDINECERKTSLSCLAEATCTNTYGSHRRMYERHPQVQRRCISTWSPWSPWSPCSVTCGIQNRMRIRECTHEESGMRCLGPSADLKGWSVWSPWSVCLETCSGIKKRVRLCDSPPASRGVDGAWSPWASWTPCPVSCGLGVVRRSRRCNNPSPKHGGENCSGHGYEEGTCGFPVRGPL
ncbi:hypothetical protein E2320_006120 [Naja naja]|nr:hypothetical protein E2320_006120 [Naja naja]